MPTLVFEDNFTGSGSLLAHTPDTGTGWAANSATPSADATLTGAGRVRGKGGAVGVHIVPAPAHSDLSVEYGLYVATDQPYLIMQVRASTSERTAYEFYGEAGAVTMLRTVAGAGTFIDYIILPAGDTFDIVINVVTNGSQVDITISVNGVAKTWGMAGSTTHSDSNASRILSGRVGFNSSTEFTNTTGYQFDYLRVYDLVDAALTVTPETVHTRSTGNVLAVEYAGASWISAPPDFSVDVGSITGFTVTSATTANITYSAPSTGATAAITDATTGAIGNVEAVAEVVVSEGNSLMSGGGIMTETLAALTVSVDHHNVAEATQKIDDMIGQVPTQVIVHFREEAAKNIVVLAMAALNDVGAAISLANIQADYIAYGAAVHAEGGLLLVTTHSDSVSVVRADLEALDAWIRANWRDFADGFVDVALSPLVGVAGASLNETYFNPDHIHLIEAGEDVITALLTPVLQRMLTGGAVPIFMNHYRMQGIA